MRWLLFLLAFGVAAWAGYRYVHGLNPGAPLSVAAVTQAITSAAQGVPIDPKTGRPMVKCDLCQGVGTVKCRAPHCVEGWVDCPGRCLKLSVGRWEHMDVPGHDPSELWQKFRYKGGYQAWTTAHVGQVIEIRDGMPTNVGECPVCGGKGKVPDPVCHGTGQVVCGRCRGAKFIPARFVPTPITVPVRPPEQPFGSHSAEPLKTRDDAIRLKNGTVIHGQIVIDDGSTVWIRRTTGERMQIAKKQLAR